MMRGVNVSDRKIRVLANGKVVTSSIYGAGWAVKS